jgi:hypothetical protein
MVVRMSFSTGSAKTVAGVSRVVWGEFLVVQFRDERPALRLPMSVVVQTEITEEPEARDWRG